MKATIWSFAATVAVLAAIPCQPAQAGDWKQYSAGGCAPYTTATPNYNELRFRSDGVQNQSDGYRYVICPVVRDADNTWGFNVGENGDVTLLFRTNTTGTFQCTLNGGSTVGGSHAITLSTSGDPGETLSITFPDVDFWNEGISDGPVSIVCRLPPKGTLAKYSVNEDAITDDPPLAP